MLTVDIHSPPQHYHVNPLSLGRSKATHHGQFDTVEITFASGYLVCKALLKPADKSRKV